MPNLMWFRNDLRITDNHALSAAVGDGSKPVIGLFLICPKTWLKHNWGSPRVPISHEECPRTFKATYFIKHTASY